MCLLQMRLFEESSPQCIGQQEGRLPFGRLGQRKKRNDRRKGLNDSNGCDWILNSLYITHIHWIKGDIIIVPSIRLQSGHRPVQRCHTMDKRRRYSDRITSYNSGGKLQKAPWVVWCVWIVNTRRFTLPSSLPLPSLQP